MVENSKIYKIKYEYETVTTTAIVAIKPMLGDTKESMEKLAKSAFLKASAHANKAYPDTPQKIHIRSVEDITETTQTILDAGLCWVYDPALAVIQNY